jgi:hypothetical protein
VPEVTAHGMRGLHGTLAVERGATTHVVAQALGHESETTSRESYISREAIPAPISGGSWACSRAPGDALAHPETIGLSLPDAVMIRRISLPRSLVSQKQ